MNRIFTNDTAENAAVPTEQRDCIGEDGSLIPKPFASNWGNMQCGTYVLTDTKKWIHA